MAFRACLFALVATVLVLLPAASAQTTISSADNKVRGSVGLLNEPVATYAVTGLEVCFTQTTATSPPPTVAVGNAGQFTARLRAPNGETHTAPLKIPSGKPNCLTFSGPLVLTQPGQYHLDLTGSINGTTFDVKDIKAGGEVVDRALVKFPSDGVLDEKALQAKVAALEARLATLEAKDAADAADESGKFAPGAQAALIMAGLAGFVALLRRRED